MLVDLCECINYNENKSFGVHKYIDLTLLLLITKKTKEQ
jgi:hypothetical protein